MKTLKNVLKVLSWLLLVLIIGYFVFTGKQL